MNTRSIPILLITGLLAVACSTAMAQDRHPLDVELGEELKPDSHESTGPDWVAPAILGSQSLKSLLTQASDFAFVVSQAEPDKRQGSGPGLLTLDDPVRELKKLTQSQLFRLALATGLDDPAVLSRWRQAVLTGSSTDRSNPRPTILDKDLRPGVVAGVTREKAIELVVRPHILDGELEHGDSDFLDKNSDYARFVWSACEQSAQSPPKYYAQYQIQTKPDADVDPLSQIDDALIEEFGALDSGPAKPDRSVAKAKLLDRSQIRLAIARKLLNNLDTHEIGKLTGKEQRFEVYQDEVAAMLFSEDGQSLMAFGWEDLSDRLTKRQWDVGSLRTTHAELVNLFQTPANSIEYAKLAHGTFSPKQDWLAVMTPTRRVLDTWRSSQNANLKMAGGEGMFLSIGFTPQGRLLTAYQADKQSEIRVSQHDPTGTPQEQLVEQELVSVPVTKKIESQGLPLVVQFGTHAFSMDRHPTQPILATATVRYEDSVGRKQRPSPGNRDEQIRFMKAVSAVKVDDRPATQVELWDLSLGKRSVAIPDVGYSVFAFTVSRYYADSDTHRIAPRSDYYCLTRFSPDGKTLFAGYSLIDVNASKIRAELERRDTLFDCVFAPDSSWLATIGHAIGLQKTRKSIHTGLAVLPVPTHVLRFWDTGSGELLAEIDLGGESVAVQGNDVIAPSLALSPKGDMLATTLGSGDATIRLWNINHILSEKPKIPDLDPDVQYPVLLAYAFYDFAADAQQDLEDKQYVAALRGFDNAIKSMESHGEKIETNEALFRAYERRIVTLGMMNRTPEADAEMVRLMSVPEGWFGIKLIFDRQMQLASLQRAIKRDPKNPHLFDLLRKLVNRYQQIDSKSNNESDSARNSNDGQWAEYGSLVDQYIHQTTQLIDHPRNEENRAEAYSHRAFLQTMKDDRTSAKRDIDLALEIEPSNQGFAEERRRIEIGMHMASSPATPIPDHLRRAIDDNLSGTTWRKANRGRKWTFLPDGKLHDTESVSQAKNEWRREGNQLKATLGKPGYEFVIEGDVLRSNKANPRLDEYWIRDPEQPETLQPKIELDRAVALDAFVAGAAWANVVTMNWTTEGKGEDMTRAWKLAENTAQRFEIELPDLPRLSGSRQRDLRTTLMQLFRSKPLAEKIAEKHSAHEAYYFELAVNIKLAAPVIAIKQDSLLNNLVTFLQRAETDGGLPPEIWQPYVELLKSESPADGLQDATLQINTSVIEFLRAKTD